MDEGAVILHGGEVILPPPNPAVIQVIWPYATCEDWTRYFQPGLLGGNSSFTTQDVLVNINVYTSLYYPNHDHFPPTASDYATFTIAALRHDASRITLNFAAVLFWAQPQETVNGKLTFVQPIPEQARRAYIQGCFNCIEDEIIGSFFERLRAVINGTPKDERNNYSNEDSLKISTVLALFNAQIWTYCAATDSIVRLPKSEGLVATVRTGCYATLQFALDAVNQLRQLNDATIGNVKLKGLFRLTQKAIEVGLTHPVPLVTSANLREPPATETTTGSVLTGRLTGLYVDIQLNIAVLPHNKFVYNTQLGPRPVQEIPSLGNAVSLLKKAVYHTTATERIQCNPSASLLSGLNTVNRSGRQTVLLGSLTAKRKGIFVERQIAESEFGTDGNGLVGTPDPNEYNSYPTDSGSDSDDEENDQGVLKRANLGPY